MPTRKPTRGRKIVPPLRTVADVTHALQQIKRPWRFHVGSRIRTADRAWDCPIVALGKAYLPPREMQGVGNTVADYRCVADALGMSRRLADRIADAADNWGSKYTRSRLVSALGLGEQRR